MKNVNFQEKIREILTSSGAAAETVAFSSVESGRIRELESELRIAKEVSVRYLFEK